MVNLFTFPTKISGGMNIMLSVRGWVRKKKNEGWARNQNRLRIFLAMGVCA